VQNNFETRANGLIL